MIMAIEAIMSASRASLAPCEPYFFASASILDEVIVSEPPAKLTNNSRLIARDDGSAKRLMREDGRSRQ